MDEKTQQKIKNFIDKNELFLVGKFIVTKLHNRGGIDFRIILLTENYFFIFTKNFKFKYKYSWYTINSLSFSNSTISISFTPQKPKDTSKVFSFKYDENIKQIYYIICTHLHSILSNYEFSLLKINSKESLQPHSGIAVIWRLSYFIEYYRNLKSTRNKYKIQDFDAFAFAIFQNRESFDMSTIPQTIEAYLIALNTLKLNYCIKELVFKNTSQYFDVLDLLAEKFDFDSVEHLYFDNIPITKDNIQKFAKALSNSKDTRMIGITFENSNITDEFIAILLPVLQQRCIYSLSLKSILDNELFEKLITTKSFKSIRYLSLKKTSFFNLSLLTSKMKNLYALSLAKCGKNVGEILEILQNGEMTNLRALDISYNFGSMIDKKALKLPKNLITLNANNIKWNTPDLLAFTSIISQHKCEDGLDLFSVSLDKMRCDNMSQFWLYLKNMDASNIKYFSFNHNTVSHELIIFLKTAKNLEYLSVNDCFDDSNVKLIASLIRNNQSLKDLIMQGADPNIVVNFAPIISALPTATNLKFVDFSYHSLKYEQVKILITNLSKIETFEGVALDSTRIETCEKWCDILEPVVQKRKAPFFISMPFIDMNRYKNESENLTKFRQFLSILAKQKVNKHWLKQPTYSYFYFQPKPCFPSYLTKNAMLKIQKLYTSPTKDGKYDKTKDVSDEDADSEETNELADYMQSPRTNNLINCVVSSSIFNLQNQQKSYKSESPKSKKSPEKPKRDVKWDFPLEYVPEINNQNLLKTVDEQLSLLNVMKDLCNQSKSQIIDNQ